MNKRHRPILKNGLSVSGLKHTTTNRIDHLYGLVFEGDAFLKLEEKTKYGDPDLRKLRTKQRITLAPNPFGRKP